MKRILLVLLFLCSNAFGAITDLKLSTAQIFDVQWYISGGTLNASGFNYIYSSVNYATQTTSAARWTAAQTSDANSNGRYIGFFNSTTNPDTYGMAVFNSDGTRYKIINNTGTFAALANGAIFYNGNGMWGTLITTGQGYSNGQSGSWAITQSNPTNSQLQAYTPPSSTPLSSGQTAAPPVTYTTTYSTETTTKLFGNRTIDYAIPMKHVRNNSTGATTSSPVTPAVIPSGYISIVPYTGGGGWQNKTYTYTATTTGTGYLMFAFRHDINYWVIDNVSIKANNTGSNLLVNGGMEKSGMMTVTVGGRQQTVAAPTAWGLAYQTNQGNTLGGGFDSGMWYDTSTGSYGAIYQNVNFTAGVTYTITFMVASDYNSNGDTVQMAVYAGNCDASSSSTACTLPASTGMTTAVTPSETYTVGCTTDCPANPGGGGAATWPANSDITTIQAAQKAAAKSRVATNQLGNSIYLDQKIGSSGNTVNIEQTGNYNKIAGLGGTEYAIINGDSNTLNIKQGDTLGKNLIEFSVTGNNNNITLWQARNITTGVRDGAESGGHYIGLGVNGNSNTIAIKQGNEGATNSGHFGLMTVTGNSNTMTLRQAGNGEKTAFVIVDGNNNAGSVYQYGVGGTHYTDLVLTGNGHTADITQAGATTHKATVNLTNVGGASNVMLLQQGATAQNINITQQCATLSGCSVSVTQGTGP